MRFADYRGGVLRWLIAGAILLALLPASLYSAPRPLRVITTFLPGYSFAANVAGDRAKVENLLSGNVSLHDYQLTPADLRKLAEADLIVINGLGMETFLDRLLPNIGNNPGERIVRLSDGMDSLLIEESGGQHREEPGHDHARNPHIWLDPTLAMRSVTNLLVALKAKDPKNAQVYEQNAASYLTRLRKLDSDAENTLRPLRNSPFVTYHSAFPYFVRRYGLTLVGVVEQTAEVAPSPREVSKLLQEIRNRKAQALFTEPGTSPRLAQQIARDTGIALAELDPIETGVLAPGSYEEAMRRNLGILKKALSQ